MATTPARALARDVNDVTLEAVEDLRRDDILLGWWDPIDGWFILERDVPRSRMSEWIVNTTTSEAEAEFIWFQDGSMIKSHGTISVAVVMRRRA